VKITFNLKKLRNNPETPWFLLDLAMVFLVSFNLLWILFDWMFSSPLVAGGIHYLSPSFHDFYADKIHADFILYDLMFVSIYLAELSLRWIVAIYKNTYERWFFFPFIHWYDVLGCIPIGSFRFLRILRVISIIYRLQKLEIIDIRENYFYKVFQKYLGIFTEEVSDRVVINVLNGVTKEINDGSPVGHKIQERIIEPNQKELVGWVGSRLGSAIDHAYMSNSTEVRSYLKTMVHESLKRNNSVKRLNLLPIIGEQIQVTMEDMSVELVEDVLVTLLEDLADSDQQLAANIINSLLQAPAPEEAHSLWPILQEVTLESIELIKEQVSEKQWKN
jgi:hypothetical protein